VSLDEPQEDDQVEVINGVQIAIERDIMEFTNSLALDYNEYRGFVLVGLQSC